MTQSSNLYVPQSHGIHTAITKDILGGSCGIAASSIFVRHIAELEDMQRR